MEAGRYLNKDFDSDIPEGQTLVLAALEPDQLVTAKLPFGRRHLSWRLSSLMWALRLYVLLMLVVVAARIVQAWGLHQP